MKKNLIAYFIIGILVGIDLATKRLAELHIGLNQSITVIDNFFWLTNVRNTGAGWSILSGHSFVLGIISLLAAIFLLSYFHKQPQSKISYIAFILIIAGTIGNMIDRLSLQYVRDFLSFKIFGYMYPVFNLADSFLVVGCFLLVLEYIGEKWHGTKS